MDFLSRGYKGLLGEKGQPQSVEDTVAKLSDRANNSTLLEDRRAAILGLKSLSREYRLEVGEHALPGLLRILNEDKEDVDIVKAILEILNILCMPDRQEDPNAVNLGVRFTDNLVSESEDIHLLLDLLRQYDFYVRYHAVQLLSMLLTIRPERVQGCVLSAPMGISRLMDLLEDKREIIRNEGLLLLIALTESNADIQKIVAFENAFERLLEITAEEDGLNGGIIVQDCLQLIVNLLRYNVSNQNYFRETSCIKRIPELLGYAPLNNKAGLDPLIEFLVQEWAEQQISNTYVLLELIKILVAPNNTNTIANQNVMNQCGVLRPTIELALASNAPSPVKTQALYALADLIRANQASQEHFAKIVISLPHPSFRSDPSNSAPNKTHSREASQSSLRNSLSQDYLPPRPAIMVLIAIAVGAEHLESYASRAAATYTFECYIYDSFEGQIVLASTLIPPPDSIPNPDMASEKVQSAGTLLLSALLDWEESSADPYVVWFASVIFSHILRNNERAKEYARLITTEGSGGDEKPVALLYAISGNLTMATRNNADVRVLIGYLCLLCVWLWDSPKSVREFLTESSHLQILIAPITQSSGVDARVQGLCAFLLGICYEFNHDPDAPISRSTLQTILLNRIGIDQFVNRITRLREEPHFKHASQYLQVSPEEEIKGMPQLFFDYHFVEFFKKNYETIQKSIMTDPKVGPTPRRSTDLNGSLGASENEYSSASAVITSLRDCVSTQEQQINEMKERIRNLEQELETEKTSAANQISSLKAEVESLQGIIESKDSKYAILENNCANLEKEQEDLMVLMADQEESIKKYRTRLEDLGQEVSDEEEAEDEDEEEGEGGDAEVEDG